MQVGENKNGLVGKEPGIAYVAVQRQSRKVWTETSPEIRNQDEAVSVCHTVAVGDDFLAHVAETGLQWFSQIEGERWQFHNVTEGPSSF